MRSQAIIDERAEYNSAALADISVLAVGGDLHVFRSQFGEDRDDERIVAVRLIADGYACDLPDPDAEKLTGEPAESPATEPRSPP